MEFIAALYQHHNVHRACLATGISRRGALKVRAQDPLFADAWAEALASHVDDIEDHVMTQAKTSKAPLWAIFALKAHRPDLYGDRIKVDQNVETEVTVILGGAAAEPQDAVGSPAPNDTAISHKGNVIDVPLLPGSGTAAAVDSPGSPVPQPHGGKEPAAAGPGIAAAGPDDAGPWAAEEPGSTYVDLDEPEQEDG